MATNIVGTFPILNSKKSQTDEYGFDYLTYQYTIKTETIDLYIPKKDDIFDGLALRYSKSSGLTNQYVVTSVESTRLDGGLTELAIETVGTKNTITNNLPKITIRQGGPLIFGLSSDIQSENPNGVGVDGVGLQIEFKFIDSGSIGKEADIYNTYFGKLIPASFRGVESPQTVQPFDIDNRDNIVVEGQQLKYGYWGYYYGYCCKSMITDRKGGLSLYTLVFSECGVLYRMFTPSLFLVKETTVYNFPRIG